MTKVLFILAFSLSVFSLLGFYSVSTGKVIMEEDSSQAIILDIEDKFSDPSIPLNEVYGDDWYAR